MKFKYTIFAIITFLCWAGYGQEKTKDNVVGKAIVIPSELMGDERTITVYLPDSYNGSDKKYPVLYLLDGQRYFLHGVSLHATLTGFNQTPEFIIVGIVKKASDRNQVYTARSKQYLEFIEKEILAYVNANFLTSGEQLLFGWAFGGGFVLETLLTKPNLFNAHIAASPFPIKQKIPRIDSLIQANPKLDQLLYFSSETSEGRVKEGTEALDSLFRTNNNTALHWKFKQLESEEHRSTPFTTLYHGLTQYFQFYPELQFNTLEAFEKAGGLPFVYDYYKKRAFLYGFLQQPSDWTMFSLARNAIREDDFEQFDILMNAFENSLFLERLRLSRACEIAEFYLEHKQFEKALNLFKLLAEKYPESQRPLLGLGNTYEGMNQPKKAKLYHGKAKKLSEE